MNDKTGQYGEYTLLFNLKDDLNETTNLAAKNPQKVKELEDLARPSRATAGAAVFRGDLTVERQFEVIEPAVLENGWIPLGRDTALEQAILQQIKKCM